MQPLAEQQLSIRAPCKGVDILMGVTRSKAGRNHLTLVCLVIAIAILEENEILSLPDINSTVAQRETGGHVQSVHKDRSLVGATIAILILKDENLILRHFGGNDLGIDE